MDEADHCGDLLLMREGNLVAHTTPTQLREDTGCTSLEDAFLSIIKRSTMQRRRLGLQASLKPYTATTTRILRQLAADHRSVAMILAVPVLVITLMYFMFQNAPHRPGTPTPFNNACLILLGLFPLFVMFIITSITMQRERASGTLERILTTPLRRLDLLVAYGTAFSIAAAAQAMLACAVSFWFLGFDTAGSPLWVFVIAIVNAVLGVGLGLLCSAFARTEFQAVQFIPLVMVPQLLLAGIIVPRALMPDWLQWISNVHAGQLRAGGPAAGGLAHRTDRHRGARHRRRAGLRARGAVPGRGDAAATDAMSVTAANTGRRRPGRPAGNSDTRDRILASARELFARNGIDRTSIRAVAAGAGVDAALVHHYFGTKQQLFAAAIHLPIDPMTVLVPMREMPVEELGLQAAVGVAAACGIPNWARA